MKLDWTSPLLALTFRNLWNQKDLSNCPVTWYVESETEPCFILPPKTQGASAQKPLRNTLALDVRRLSIALSSAIQNNAIQIAFVFQASNQSFVLLEPVVPFYSALHKWGDSLIASSTILIFYIFHSQSLWNFFWCHENSVLGLVSGLPKDQVRFPT